MGSGIGAAMVAYSCPNCWNWQQAYEKLQLELQAAYAEAQTLKDTINRLELKLAAAQRDSTNSSKPPASDTVKPPPKAADSDEEKRKIGAQPGHTPHFRTPFTPEEITETIHHQLHQCPDCGGTLADTTMAPQIIQQIDVLPVLTKIEEHQAHTSWCPHCQKHHAAPMPPNIEEGGLFGPRLTALVAYLKGACHASFSTIRKYFRDVLRIKVSRGHLRNLIHKVSTALKAPYEELLKLLPSRKILNVDETGHKQSGKLMWTWCFRAELFTLFHINPCRGSDVLIEALGKQFAGIIGCDCFSAYRKYMRLFSVELQLCLAHLLRDLEFLASLPQPKDREYGETLRDLVRELFIAISMKDELPPEEFRALLGLAPK